MEATFSSLMRANPRSPCVLLGTSIAATIAFITITRLALPPRPPPKDKITRSPLQDVLLNLSKSEQDALPYPPDIFPGARDVPSQYGNIRVYEWGPLDGHKVLFLHGISTPCVALGNIATALVETKGCRVLLMDLFGRGYSDAPADLPHDARLYTTQIMLAITSSPLAWTPEGFSLIGYSFGGGLAADFAVRFPGFVRELVLLAPGGLIRERHFGWAGRLLYGEFVPGWVVDAVVGRRLRGSSVVQKLVHAEEGEDVVSAEVKGNRDPSFESAVLSRARPHVTVASVVSWQVERHEGFVRSFVSSIRYAPVKGQGETWRLLGGRERKVLIVVGSMDSIIVAEELKVDALEAIGEGKVEWRVVDGGHEFPITRSDEVVRIISESWKLP